MCVQQVFLVDRVGNIQQAEEFWSEEKKLSLLTIRLQNWDQPDYVKNFTTQGFEVRPIPSALYSFLLDMLDKDKMRPEPCAPSAHINCVPGEQPAKVEVVPVKDGKIVKTVLGKELKELAETWSGVGLELSSVYGVRNYRRGARLALHVDRLATHVVSFILNIQQQVDDGAPWYLDILDNNGEYSQVELEQGEMVLYESARLPHGRTSPFQGESYMNIFVHFRPVIGWYEENWAPYQSAS